jgi:hypothetical protein
MSMGSLFSSPQKQAQGAESTVQGIDQQDIQQVENYVAAQQGQERSAIANLGENPYFQAASTLSPSSYAVNPSDAVAFGSSGPGTTLGTTSVSNAFAQPATATPTTTNAFAAPKRTTAQGTAPAPVPVPAAVA